MAGKGFSYDTYLSVFTWRYGSPEMRRVFSELTRRSVWRRLWVSLAEAQSKYGLVSEEELKDLKSKMGPEHIDIERAHEIEEQVRHHIMAEILAYAEQAPVGGGRLHIGATSADIEDNADIMMIRDAAGILLTRLVNCIATTAKLISEHRDTPCMGWTHLQPAEPITIGYRFANYAQDLALDLSQLEHLLEHALKGKGFKGAVGSSASFKALLGGKATPSVLEAEVMKPFGLQAYPVATQTYPRKLDYLALSVLAGIAQSAHRFAFDVRILQSPTFGEVLEPMTARQIGSSTMAFKRNPLRAERICSLARYVSILPWVALMNAANTLFERTLDDHASRTVILPEGFLATEECLLLYDRVADGLTFYPKMIRVNLERFGVFSGTEALLVKLSERGADRQEMHERIRGHAFRAWERVMEGEDNPLPEMLKKDSVLSAKLTPEEVNSLLDPSKYVGDAPERCTNFLNEIVQPILAKYKDRVGRRAEPRF